jgi:dynein heavy chain
MKKAVLYWLQESLVAYLKMSRIEWVQKWSGQTVLTGSQVYWTQEVTEAITKGALKELEKTLNNQLLDLVALVRQDLPRLLRLVLADLIVIDVHAKDVVERMAAANVPNVSDFEWKSQLRYYYEDNDLYVKILNANFKYGYEYIGNGRLVITQLTDRCYLTVATAINLNMGAAPAGTNMRLF